MQTPDHPAYRDADEVEPTERSPAHGQCPTAKGFTAAAFPSTVWMTSQMTIGRIMSPIMTKGKGTASVSSAVVEQEGP
jgi:hypothetical protein